MHSSMVLHPNPKSVAILGGGRGATLREILRHRTVQSVQMVDIDGKWSSSAKACRAGTGSFSDPRAEIIIGDAKQFIEEGANRGVIFPTCSPAEDTPVFRCTRLNFPQAETTARARRYFHFAGRVRQYDSARTAPGSTARLNRFSHSALLFSAFRRSMCRVVSALLRGPGHDPLN